MGDLFRLSNDMKVTHCKKPKPSQILEVEAMEVTSDLSCLSEVCTLLETCAPEGYRPLRLLLLASSRTISEEMQVSRISDLYLRCVEEGIEGSELAEKIMNDYLTFRD